MTDNQRPGQADPAFRGGELSFTDIVAFFHRHWQLIFGAAALAAIATVAVLLVAIQRKYEASATLVIVPPRFSSDLKPETLTVQGYQQILESDAVIGEARRKLIAKGVIPAGSLLRLGRELRTNIFVSRRAEETTLAPMLQAVARARTGEQAATIANTWAEVFLERTRGLMAGSTSSTVKFIDSEYPKARDDLAKLEDTRVTEANALQRRRDDVATSWDDKISAFKNGTTQLVSNDQVETRRLIETFQSAHNLDSKEAQLKALRKAYADLQDEQARVASQLQLKQLQLEAARRQLAATPPLVTLQKAMTDDAMWRSVAGGKEETPDWKALQQRSLVTQEVNPVYTSLSAKTAEIEMDVNAMTPRAAGLTKDLDRISSEMKSLETNLRGEEASLEKLQREREAGLAQLQEQRANALATLQRDRQGELDGLKLEADARLAQLDRDITQKRQLFDRLAANYTQALLAKGQQDVEDVSLAAPAVPPQVPEPRGLATKGLLAAMIGGLLGLGAALVRESWA